MFTSRCLSSRILSRAFVFSRYRTLSLGVVNIQTTTTNEQQIQSTINLIKDDLQLIHHDILQVSNKQPVNSFRHILDNFIWLQD